MKYDNEDVFCYSEQAIAVVVVWLRTYSEKFKLSKCSLPVAILYLTTDK